MHDLLTEVDSNPKEAVEGWLGRNHNAAGKREEVVVPCEDGSVYLPQL
jgi:hypothetical protein